MKSGYRIAICFGAVYTLSQVWLWVLRGTMVHVSDQRTLPVYYSDDDQQTQWWDQDVPDFLRSSIDCNASDPSGGDCQLHFSGIAGKEVAHGQYKELRRQLWGALDDATHLVDTIRAWGLVEIMSILLLATSLLWLCDHTFKSRKHPAPIVGRLAAILTLHVLVCVFFVGCETIRHEFESDYSNSDALAFATQTRELLSSITPTLFPCVNNVNHGCDVTMPMNTYQSLVHAADGLWKSRGNTKQFRLNNVYLGLSIASTVCIFLILMVYQNCQRVYNMYDLVKKENGSEDAGHVDNANHIDVSEDAGFVDTQLDALDAPRS